MTIIERVSLVWEDEKKTKQVEVKSWEISGTQLPKEKNLPVRLQLGWQLILLNCSYQSGDLFLAFPISAKAYLKLKWHRFWRS